MTFLLGTAFNEKCPNPVKIQYLPIAAFEELKNRQPPDHELVACATSRGYILPLISFFPLKGVAKVILFINTKPIYIIELDQDRQ